MTALLAGLDWSSKAIHAALIPLDADHGDPTVPPVVFRQETLPGLQGDATLRIRAVRAAMRNLIDRMHLEQMDDLGTVLPMPTDDIQSVWVEECWGNHRNTDRALLPIYGAIIASVPTHIPVAGISAKEWRKELRIGQSKNEAQTTATGWLADHPARWRCKPMSSLDLLDEHYSDALLVALAGRQIMQRHAGAAA